MRFGVGWEQFGAGQARRRIRPSFDMGHPRGAHGAVGLRWSAAPGLGYGWGAGKRAGGHAEKDGRPPFSSGVSNGRKPKKPGRPGFSVAQALNSHSDRENVVALTTRAIEPVFSPVMPSMRMVSGQVSSSLRRVVVMFQPPRSLRHVSDRVRATIRALRCPSSSSRAALMSASLWTWCRG
jgi:hypothetical protein